MGVLRCNNVLRLRLPKAGWGDPSDECVASLVDCHAQLEEVHVTESVGLALHGLDLVVRPFERAVRDAVIVPGQYPGSPGS